MDLKGHPVPKNASGEPHSSVLASPPISDILLVASIPAILDILPLVPSSVIPDILLVAPLESPSDSIPSSKSTPLPERIPPSESKDELDSLIDSSVEQFLGSENWTQFFHKASDPRGDWAAGVSDIDHPAADLLSLYKESGVPVVSNGDAIL